MRYGIFSDVHSNLEAFRAVVKEMESDGAEKYICIGDIVGYGANPSECIALTKSLTDKVVCGNHDWASIGALEVSYFNDYAKKAVIWTMNRLSDDERRYLQGLHLKVEDEDFVAVHGSLDEPDEFHYILDIYGAHRTFDLLNKKICFIGHSHAPMTFVKSKETVRLSVEKRTVITDESFYIVNVGSVGQPRDGDPRACYALYDSKAKTIEIKRASYPIHRTQEKIRKAGLPQVLAERLENGR